MRKPILLLSITTLLCLISPVILAQTSWKGTSSNSWNTSANWTNGVPTAGVDAIIGNASFTGSNQPTISNTAYCKSLTVGGAITSNLTIGKPLTISGNLLINSNGTLTHKGQLVTIAGNWTNSGTYTISGAGNATTFSGTAQLINGTNASAFKKVTVNAGAVVTLNQNISATASVTVNGTMIPAENATPYVISGAGSLTVSTGGIIKVNASTYAGNYALAGTHTISGGSTVEYSAATINQTVTNAFTYSTVTVTGGTTKTAAGNLSFNSSLASYGNIYVTNGTLDLSVYSANRTTTTTGGFLTLAIGTTLKIGGLTTSFFPANFSTVSLALTSNVDYNGSGTQLVSAQVYGNLVLTGPSGSVSRTMPATALTINGNLKSRVTGGTSLSYTAAANITVSGNDSIGVSTTFNAGNSGYTFRVNNNLENNGTITGNTNSTVTMGGSGAVLSGTGTNNFNNLIISSSGITANNNPINVSGNLSMGISSATFSHASGGTLQMTGASKTISGSGFTFNALTVATAASVSTTTDFTVKGDLSVAGTGTFSATAGVITMTGSGKSINTGTGLASLHSLVISSTAGVTTASNFTILTNLIIQGSLTASANTVTFNGISSLSGTANLYHVAINSTKSLQMNNNAVLGIAGTFTNAGSFNATAAIPNTVIYNGAAQTVLGLTYYNLTTANSNTKTTAAAVIINGDLTINSSTTFDAGSYSHVIQRNLVNNGTFVAGSSTVTFSGTNDATISGVTVFVTITVNKSSSTNILTAGSNISAATVNMTSGNISTGTNTLTITTTRTGTGIIWGIITRTHAFTLGTAYAFESPNNLISFTGSSSVTSVTEKITAGSIADFPFGGSVNRVYDISSVTGSYGAATLRLHYEDVELNGNTESSMQLWHYNGSAWTLSGKTSNDATNNYVEQTGITTLTNRWTFSDNNNVVSWNGTISTDWFTAGNWTTVQGTPGKPPTANDIVRIGDANFTGSYQPSVNANAVAKTIDFESDKISSLTLNSGGSMTLGGNITGAWSGNVTHNIYTNAQNLTVNGDIILSDGTSGHAINLTIGTGTITVAGSVTQSGGANIIFSGAGNMNIANNFNYSSGTFTAGTGTLTYNGTNAQTVAPVTYYNLSVNKTSGIASINNSTIGGNLTAANGELDINATTTITGNVLINSGGSLVKTTADTLKVGGNWTNNGIFTVSTGAVVFNGSVAQVLSGATTFNNFVVSKTTGSTLSLAANVTVNSDLVITGGILDMGTYTANRASSGGTFSMTNGTMLYVTGANNFPASYITYAMDTTSVGTSSTVIYNGTVAQTVLTVSYGHLIFSGSGIKTLSTGITEIKGDLTINAGANLDGSAYMIALYGNWLNNGTFTPTTSNCMFYGTGKTISGNTTFYRSVVYGSYSVPGFNITYNANVRIATGGTLNAGSGVITIYGDYTNNGTNTSTGTITFAGTILQTIRVQNAVISSSTGIVNFNGTVAPVLNSTTNTTFATVNINNTGGVTPSLPWTVFVALNVASGSSWNGGNYTHTFRGAFTNNGTVNSGGVLNFIPSSAQSLKLAGTSFNSTGTVVFGGTGAITTTGAVPTFTNVTVASMTGVTPGTNWTVAGNLIINDTATLNAGSNTYTVAGDVNSAGTLSAGTSVFNMTGAAGNIYGSTNTTFYDLAIATGARTAIGADFNVSRNLTTTGNLDATVGLVKFTGATASVISGASVNLAQFTIAKNTGITTTLSRNVDSLQALNITGGILDAGTAVMTQDPTPGAVNTLSIGSAGTLKTAGVFPLMTNYSIDSLSTVEYYGSTQTIKSLSAFVTDQGAPSAYGNLTVSSAGTKTANGPLNIRNDLTLSTGTLSFPNGGTNYEDTLGGNWNMINGTFIPGTGVLVFNGGSTQGISSTGAFNNININKPAGYLNFTGNITANGSVTFTSGKIYTNTNTFIVPTGAVTGAAQGTGWVNGNLQKTIATGAVNKTFETGGALYYSPISVSFSNVTTGGSLTAKATATEHAQIFTSALDSARSVNRFWTLTNSGVVFTNSGATASATVNWVTSDVDAGSTTASFITGLYNGAVWTLTNFTSPLSNSIQATGLTSFGDIAVAQRGAKVWTGISSNNWNVAGNWDAAVIPLSTEDILIPTGSIVNINTNVTCNNMTLSNAGLVVSIASGNTLTVNGNLNLSTGILDINGQSLTLNGTFTGSGSQFLRGSKTSALLIGTAFSNTSTAIYFDQADLTFNNYLKTLTVNKTVTLGNALNLAAAGGANTGTVSIAAGATLNTGGFITLKSDNTGTARVAALPTDGAGVATAFISGEMNIERYIPARRTWRLLSVPLKSTGAPTINAAWQEGATTVSAIPNPNAGYGTHITGGTIANGFDQSPTNSASLKYYNTGTMSFQPLTSSYIPITNYPAYFLFVRGDRSVNLSLGSSATATNTTLRMKGQVNTGSKPFAVSGSNSTLISNPYPSAIDFGSLTKSNVSNIVYLWDPKLGGNYGVGGYVTGTWDDGSSAYVFTGSVSPISQYIPSGEAFFVTAADTTLSGTLTVKETDKSTAGSDQVFGFTANNHASVKVNLFSINADSSSSLADGLLALYNDDNNNAVTTADAKKMINSAENISFKRNGSLFSIEQRRTILNTDTLFINIGQLKQQQYRFEISTIGLNQPGLVAVLKDNYAAVNNDKVLALNSSTTVEFTVNAEVASSATDRFRIVFMTASVVPVTFTSVTATRRQKDIAVNWKTENEINMASYTVERAADPIHFTAVANLRAHVNQQGLHYQWTDLNADSRTQFYRIKGIGINGNITYSTVVKVAADNELSGQIKIYAAAGGNTIKLDMQQAVKNKYAIEVFDYSGRTLLNTSVTYLGGTESFTIPIAHLPAGAYRMRLSSGEKTYLASFIIP